MRAFEGIKLLLQLDYGLISLVEPRGECDHDVPLLEEESLVAVHLCLVLLHLLALDLQLVDASLIFLPESPLLFFESRLKLGQVLYLLASN